MSKDKKKHLIAVYGTLRKGCSNNKVLGDSDYVGTFESKPIFNMFSVSESFPALKLSGQTSVLFEVYKASDEILKNVDELEGYNKDNKSLSMYDRKRIFTPYGESYFYIFEGTTNGMNKINSGDWVEYITTFPVLKLLANA